MTGANAALTILAVGFLAGILSGLFGIGGGLVIVPALVIVAGLDQKTATGTSLFALLLPTGLLAVLEYHKQGHLRWQYGLLIVPGLLLGGKLGAMLTRGLPEMTMKRIYAGFLVIVAIYYLILSTPGGKAMIFGRGVAKPAAGADKP